MKKHLSAALAAGMLLLTGPVFATAYEYHFTSNPDIWSAPVDRSLDVQMTFGFDDALLPSLNIGTLNEGSYWQSGAIWLRATYNGVTVNLGDGLDYDAAMLSFSGEHPGVIETFRGNFLDIDIHPGNTIISSQQLPFDPFVGGQLNAYRDQADYIDLQNVWLRGDSSSLAAHAVPEPGTWALMATGLVTLLGAARRKKAAR